MSIILPNLNHSFISPVPVPDPDFWVFHTPVFDDLYQLKCDYELKWLITGEFLISSVIERN